MDTTHATDQGLTCAQRPLALSQVKLRGYRLELGEIEAAALAAPGVILAAAVVCTRGDAALRVTTVSTRTSHATVARDAVTAAKAAKAAEAAEAAEVEAGLEAEADAAVQQLLLYVTPADVSVDALRATLRTLLPSHAQPNMVVPLPALPTNAAGKLDRAALPAAAAAAAAAAADGMVGSTAVLHQTALDLDETLATTVSSAAAEASGTALQIAELTTRVEAALGIPVGLTREGGGGGASGDGALLVEVPRCVHMPSGGGGGGGGGGGASGLVEADELDEMGEGGEGDDEEEGGDERLASVWAALWDAEYRAAMPTDEAVVKGLDSAANHGVAWRGVGYLQPAGGPFECSSAALEAWADSAARRIRALAAGRTRRVLEVSYGTRLRHGAAPSVRSCTPMCSRLHPSYARGCNPICSRLHPYVLEAATLCATLCARGGLWHGAARHAADAMARLPWHRSGQVGRRTAPARAAARCLRGGRGAHAAVRAACSKFPR